MIGWYLDVVIGYLIRNLIHTFRARRSGDWPVETATVGSSRCPSSVGGPVAEVGYMYTHEESYFAGIHRKPFMSRDSAEAYAAKFPPGSKIIARVRPGEPETSLVCDEDQPA